MRKLVTYAVVVTTIVWSLGLAAVVPASAAYTPVSGDLIKTATDSAVYYIDADGKRNLIVNEVTFWTWYSGSWSNIGFGNSTKTVQTISQADFDSLAIGDHVVVRPGVKLIKFQNSPRVYAVTPGSELREVVTSSGDNSVAKALYGDGYASKVITIQNGFENDYTKGSALTASSNLPDGSLVKYSGSEDIYYIDNGMKRMVSDDAFVANAFMDSAVVTIAASMTYSTGDNITDQEAGLTTISGPAVVGAGAGGTLSVALASDTPSAGLLVYNASRVPMTAVNLTATGGDVTVDSVTIERTGPATDSTLATVALIDGNTNVQIGLNQNLNSSHQANINNDFVVKAGTTKKIILAGNVAATGAGQVAYLALAGIAVKSGSTVVASLPITGNGHTLTSLTIGQATVQRGTFENATSTTLKVGQTSYIVASYKISADSTEGQKVEQIKFYQNGTASLSTDLGNYQLLVDNTTQVNATFTVDGKYVTAEFSANPVIMEKGKNKELTLKADVLSGSTRTVKMGIYRTTDVITRGTTYGYSRTPAYSGTGASGSSPVLESNQFTISAGTLRVESSVTVGAKDVSYGDGQVLGAFGFVVAGEPVEITQLILTNSSTTVDSNQFDNVKLVDATSGEVYWGPDTADAANVDDITYSTTVILPVGTTVVNVVADIESTSGFLNNATFNWSINPSNITAVGSDTTDTITATPSAAVSAATLTFKPGKLVITREALPADGNVTQGSNDFLYGSWVFDATGSGEDVRITAIKIGNNAGTTTNVDNLTLYVDGVLVTPINEASGATSTFTLDSPIVITKNTSKTIQLKGDVRTTAGVTSVDEFIIRDDGTVVPVTAVGVLTGNTITPTGSGYNATDGADITVVGAGTLTINTAASDPGLKIVATGSTVELGRFKLTAANEAIDVTDLTICVGDGGLTGTATGNEDDVASIMVYKATDMSTPILSRSMSANCEAFTLNAGVLQVPKDTTSGVEVVVKGTMAEFGTGQTGTANADVLVAISADAAGIRGTGVDSGAAVSETYTANTSSGVILHQSYPTVTVNTPDTTLASGAVAYDVTINNPTSETVAIYRLTFVSSSSSGDVEVTSGGLQAKLIGTNGWASFKQIAADGAGTQTATTPHLYFSFVLWNPDTTSQTKKELQIPAGHSAQFQFIARAVSGLDGTSGESLQFAMLGDNASSTGNDGNIGDAFTVFKEGNFAWSDLNSNTGSTSNGASSTAQWYNGYLVNGLQSTSTFKTLSE